MNRFVKVVATLRHGKRLLQTVETLPLKRRAYFLRLECGGHQMNPLRCSPLSGYFHSSGAKATKYGTRMFQGGILLLLTSITAWCDVALLTPNLHVAFCCSEREGARRHRPLTSSLYGRKILRSLDDREIPSPNRWSGWA